MFHNMKDVGFLQVKVIRAEGLMAADVTGKKSFNFCGYRYLTEVDLVYNLSQNQQCIQDINLRFARISFCWFVLVNLVFLFFILVPLKKPLYKQICVLGFLIPTITAFY